MIEDVKRIPYGVSNFVEVVEQNQYYVDKTMYLPLLEQQPNSLFFIRPRRFGKSLLTSTLHCYFAGKKDLSKGLPSKSWKPSGRNTRCCTLT